MSHEMGYNHYKQFSTIDRDNDMLAGYNCVRKAGGGGGWWYGGKMCSSVYPTAIIGKATNQGPPYMYWWGAFPDVRAQQAIKSMSMYIKPVW